MRKWLTGTTFKGGVFRKSALDYHDEVAKKENDEAEDISESFGDQTEIQDY